MTAVNRSLLHAGGLRYVNPSSSLHLVEFAREEALNALLPATFHALHNILDHLTSLPTPTFLLLTGRGRAFSAGGDVRALRDKLLAAGPVGSPARVAVARDTLSTEYDLLERVAGLQGSRVVTVGLADGLAFGAGAGLFQACAVRLVTTAAVMAMPEVGIGIVPDCGATRFFAAAPGCAGMYAALTGARVSAGDMLALRLADGAVETGWRGDGIDEEGWRARVEGDAQLVEETRTELADAGSEMRREIDECFSLGSLVEVVEAVETRARGKWKDAALKALRGGSPVALRATFEAMREAYGAGGEGIREALDRELEADCVLAAGWDFEEGVRAVLVDKDNAPKWDRSAEKK